VGEKRGKRGDRKRMGKGRGYGGEEDKGTNKLLSIA